MKRRRTAQEQKLADDARLLRAWKKFHAEEKAAVLAGPYSTTLVELFRMFANIECVKPAQLIGFIGAVDWAAIDYPTRLVVLHELNNAVTAYRTKRRLEPIDDNVPGQPETPFRTLKAIIVNSHVPNVAPTEAQLGSNTETPVK
jgi:hypothetical protein